MLCIPYASTLIITALHMRKFSWLLMTHHWIESKVFVLSSKTLHSLISVSHSSPCSHWCLRPVYTSFTKFCPLNKAPSSLLSAWALASPTTRQMPFIKCPLSLLPREKPGSSFTFYREGHLLHISLAKNIPALSSKFLQDFAYISHKPVIFPLHYRFPSNHDDQSFGAASIFYTHLYIHFPIYCHTAFYAAFNKGLLNELTFM